MGAWTWASLGLVLTSCTYVAAARPPSTRPVHGYAGGRMTQPAGYTVAEPLQSERLTCFASGPAGQPGYEPVREQVELRGDSYLAGRANQPAGWPARITYDPDQCVSRVVW